MATETTAPRPRTAPTAAGINLADFPEIDVDRYYQLRGEILVLITQRGGGVSFVELSKIEGFTGDREYYLDPYNIVLWAGVSPEAVAAIEDLRSRQLIIPQGSSFLVYAIDGMTLRLPIAKRAVKYKKPHWLPVVFWTPGEAKAIGIK